MSQKGISHILLQITLFVYELVPRSSWGTNALTRTFEELKLRYMIYLLLLQQYKV